MKKNMIAKKHLVVGAALLAGFTNLVSARETTEAEGSFRIVDVPVPEEILLEVGGLAVLPDGSLGVATRRGDVFIVENPSSPNATFRTFAFGLHEVLGLAYKNGALYAAQRGELTKMVDTDSDGKADVLETVYAWPLSGNYHEYSFGPEIASDGSFFVTGNVGFRGNEWWRGVSMVPWRGWTMNITEAGEMQPWATGMRSPAGLGIIDGELFYTDNQGDWIGSGAIWHLPKGAFSGHPAGLVWTDEPNSPVHLKQEQLFDLIDERRLRTPEGGFIKPENIPNETGFKTMADVKPELPGLQLPAVWFPYAVQGISTSDPLEIPEGAFGPFEGQVLVGDQGQSKIMRVFLEKVNGEYQGASFDFKDGFMSGVLRLRFGHDHSLFVGMTNRGWGSAGPANEGLQRLVYNGEVPFEMKAVRAKADGFEIEFTQPVDRESAADLASYTVQSFIYKYNSVYGSPPVNIEGLEVRGVKVSEDGLRARLVVDGLRRYYVHQLTLGGIRSAEEKPLVHPDVFYTLNNLPSGDRLAMSEVSTYDSTEEGAADVEAGPVSADGVLTFEQIRPLLAKNTCTACHSVDRRQVGPAFVDVAKRNYTDERIVELIRMPEKENWPDYATPMPPMPHIPEDEVRRIAAWINSLAE